LPCIVHFSIPGDYGSRANGINRHCFSLVVASWIPGVIVPGYDYWIGVLILTGVVVNNAILIVESATASGGRTKYDEALYNATRDRLRPFSCPRNQCFGHDPAGNFFQDRDLALSRSRIALTGACIFYNSDSTVVPALMALFHDFSGDRTDHKIADLENGMYDKTVLRRFSQLTGRITDQHVCLVCGHVLGYLQTQSVWLHRL